MAAPAGATEKARKIAQKEELASFVRIFVTTKGAVLGEHWVPPTLLCKDSSQPNVYIDFAQGFEGLHSLCQEFIKDTPADISTFCAWLTPSLGPHGIKRDNGREYGLSKGVHWMTNKRTGEVGDRSSFRLERWLGEQVYRSRGGRMRVSVGDCRNMSSAALVARRSRAPL